MKRIEITKSRYVKSLFYGYPGSGKTHLCGTFALDDRSTPVLHLDCGGNPETLRQFDSTGDVYGIDKIADLNPIYDWLWRKQPKDHPLVSQMGCTPGYKTVIIDCGSDLQRYSFDATMGTENIKIADSPRAAEWSDYRGVLAMMTRIAKSFYRLDMHVIITAWEKTEINDSGMTKYRPFFQGQSIDTVPGYALSVGRLIHKSRIEGKLAQALKDQPDSVNVLLLQPSRNYDAKDQNGFNVPYMVNPTATKLLDLLEKQYTA